MPTLYLPPASGASGNLLDGPAPSVEGPIEDLCAEYPEGRTREILGQVFNLAIIHDTFNDPRKREQLVVFQEHLLKALANCYTLVSSAPKEDTHRPVII